MLHTPVALWYTVEKVGLLVGQITAVFALIAVPIIHLLIINVVGRNHVSTRYRYS